jgi:signal transduction histidine kinase
MSAEPSAAVTAAESEIYRRYDQQRRLGLVRGIAPAFAGLLAIFVIVLNVDAPQLPQQQPEFFSAPRVFVALLIGDPLFVGCIIAFIIGALAARRGRFKLAANLTIIATDVTVIGIELLWSFGFGGYDFMAITTYAALCIGIVLAGILDERWLLLTTTFMMNLVVLVVAFFATPPHPGFEIDASIANLASSQKLIVTIGALLVQWAITTIVLTAASANQRILRELGDVRVAYERARQLDDLKDQFISSVNHELRSPVMAMQGYLELLRLTEETAAPEKRHSLLQRAGTAADNLVALMQSILDARRLDKDADDFEPEVVNVREVITIAAGLIDPREGEMTMRELHVSVPTGLQIWGEHVRLQQILTNLLSNAIKYSDAGTAVEVSAHPLLVAEAKPGRFGRSTKVERPMVEITVRDYGYGIPPEQASLLFQRFVRLPRDLAGNTIGNGLGLHLCRVLAEAMGGRITVDSTGIPGDGTIFHVVLPVPPMEYVAESDASKTPTKQVRDSVPAKV